MLRLRTAWEWTKMGADLLVLVMWTLAVVFVYLPIAAYLWPDRKKEDIADVELPDL